MESKKWTDSEIDFLKDNYLNMTDKEISKVLNKKEGSILSKRNILKLLKNKKSTNTSEEELLEIINEYTMGVSIKDIAKKYNKTEQTIREHLKKKNVFKHLSSIWTTEEIQILKEIYSIKEWDEILKLLNNHNKESIITKASDLKIKKENYYWLEEDIQKLIKAKEDNKTIDEIYIILNKKFSITSIYTKISKLKLSNAIWTIEEIEYLKNNYDKVPLDEICQYLKNRKRRNIVMKATNDLSLTGFLTWTDIEDNFIKNNYLNMTDLEMTKYLENRTWRSIKWRREKLDMERPTSNSYGIGCINKEGEVFSSQNEMMVYEFIKSFDKLKYIKNIGTNHNKKGKYVFELDDSYEYNRFYPDFVIEYININNKKIKLLIPVIIEFYGMARFDRKDSVIINNYNKKTLEKERFYKSKNDIYYIGVFPEDIKNNYEGLVKKLNSFIIAI